MSGDDITFGEMTVREPERRQRPDRDRRFACLAYEVPGAGRPADLPRSPRRRCDRTPCSVRYVRRAGGHPAGQGMPRPGRPASRSSGSPSRSRPSTTPTPRPASPTPTTRGKKSPANATGSFPSSTSWAGITPIPASGFSCRTTICSSTSISSHSRSRSLMSSTRSTRRAVSFSGVTAGWRRSAAIYLTADRGDRIALARLVNDLEQLPNSEANSGGAFSPRLEAELINMLSRPAHSTGHFPRRKGPARGGLRHARHVARHAGRAPAIWLLQTPEPDAGSERIDPGPGPIGRAARRQPAAGDRHAAARRSATTSRPSSSSNTTRPPGNATRPSSSSKSSGR